jgi:hypothetical protein
MSQVAQLFPERPLDVVERNVGGRHFRITQLTVTATHHTRCLRNRQPGQKLSIFAQTHGEQPAQPDQECDTPWSPISPHAAHRGGNT